MNKKLNLLMGNPVFFEEYWKKHHGSTPVVRLEAHELMSYGSEPELPVQIKRIHGLLKNANIDGKYIVIGNGITQLLNASMRIMKGESVFFSSPYYYKFPMIAASAGKRLIPSPLLETPDIEVITTPTNPELRKAGACSEASSKIYDHCYNWPAYGAVEEFDNDIMLFSMSKATGHAGLRIGWAICKSEEVANALQLEITHMTGGVSRDSQVRAAQILSNQSHIIEQNMKAELPILDDTVFQHARKTMDKRWARLNSLEMPEGYYLLNAYGMFGWLLLDGVEDANKELDERFDITGNPGPACGGKGHNVRINLGCSDDDFNELLARLGE